MPDDFSKIAHTGEKKQQYGRCYTCNTSEMRAALLRTKRDIVFTSLSQSIILERPHAMTSRTLHSTFGVAAVTINYFNKSMKEIQQKGIN